MKCLCYESTNVPCPQYDLFSHAERFGIFVGLWAPTLLILSNRFDRFADKAGKVPGLKAETHDED